MLFLGKSAERLEGPGIRRLPNKRRRLRMTFPVGRLCQLPGAGAATLTLFDDEAGTEGAWQPVPFDIDVFAGAKPLHRRSLPGPPIAIAPAIVSAGLPSSPAAGSTSRSAHRSSAHRAAS